MSDCSTCGTTNVSAMDVELCRVRECPMLAKMQAAPAAPSPPGGTTNDGDGWPRDQWKPIAPPKDYSGWTCGRCGSPVAGRYCVCEGCGIDPIAKYNKEHPKGLVASPPPKPATQGERRPDIAQALNDALWQWEIPERLKIMYALAAAGLLSYPLTPSQPSAVEMARETPDYTAMDGPTLLNACGDDAAKWASAFYQMANKHGLPDEGGMIGWFANAIERSSDVRRWAREQETPAWLPIESAPKDKTLFLVTSSRAQYDVALMRGDTLQNLLLPGKPKHLVPPLYTHWANIPEFTALLSVREVTPQTPPTQIQEIG